MIVKTVTHQSGEQIPILLDRNGMPLALPNEFILSRRHLSTNTLIRNTRELSVLYRWLEKKEWDLSEKLGASISFNEADLKGGLVEALRVDQATSRAAPVSPNTFNQRLTTIRQFFGWCMDLTISQLPLSSTEYDRLRERKLSILDIFDRAFLSAPPQKQHLRKGLTESEVIFLLEILNPHSEDAYGQDVSVRHRNFVSVGLMLFCGLRPGELLSLRVADIHIGAISSVLVERRPQNPNDKRKPRPQIKRNARVIPIDNKQFTFLLNEYIVIWRDVLEEKALSETDYLILSDEGVPLSQSSVTQFFQLIRSRFSGDLPKNLTAKSLRHTFSSRLERVLRQSGVDEQRRRESLALLRGDSSLDSQDVYIAQEIEEQAIKSLKNYQSQLMSGEI